MKKKNSFARSERLTQRKEFIRLFDEPGVHRGGTFLAFFKDSETGRSRLGITIKGKVSSVWRFRIKRTIREWFRLHKDMLGNIDLNIVVKPPVNLVKSYIDRLKKDLTQWRGGV
ncbi:MAG TPA: ribonuclease P protein component [Oligoflexia bacterium]|nr:ribonuclease P protein component [Oligoflexia bacterium]